MAKKPTSTDEILAYCRQVDGGEAVAPSAEPVPSAEPAEASSEASASESSGSSAAAAKKDPKQMSVAEMLAAARAEKSGGGAKASTPSGAEPSPAAPSAAKKDPAKMSVEEMLAAARGETAAPKAAKKPAAAAKKAAPKAAPAAKAATKAADSGPKDTASILAAARKADKPGPMSKAEAAAKAKQVATPAKAPRTAPPMPEKPAYAMPPATRREAPASGESRRSFFAAFFGACAGSSLAIGFSSLAVTNVLWVLGLARFFFPNILTEPPTQFKVGFPDEYSPGSVQTKYKAQFGVWVVRYEYQGQQQIYALKAVCTHLGCTPNWLDGEQKFKCPCHGSGFYKDGMNFEGPAPRPLERYAIRVADDGQLEVDKSRTFQEEMEQWSDPASFVSV